jgi:hypothetical protein
MTALITRPRAIAISLLASALIAAIWGARMCAHRRPESDLSALARRAVRLSAEPLRPVASAAAVVYAADPRQAAAALEEAEYALLEISRRLGVAAPTTTVHILFLQDEAVWSELARRRGYRADGLAFNTGREIYLRRDVEPAKRPDRLAHELTHFVLRQTYGDGIPLWLDEGLASHLGFAVSRSYRAARGCRMAGAWPGLQWSPAESLESLTSRESVPDDYESARLFYRASEEMVAWIEDRLGTTRMREFVAAVAGGARWQDALSNFLSETRFSMNQMEADIRRAVEAPKIR